MENNDEFKQQFGFSMPDETHPYIGLKEFCDDAVAHMKSLGLADAECWHRTDQEGQAKLAKSTEE